MSTASPPGPHVAPPGGDLRRNLLRHGPDGERAERFLREAGRQLTQEGEMQGEVVAYLLREALGALLKLGGEKPFDLKQSARRVVTGSKLPEEEGGSDLGLEDEGLRGRRTRLSRKSSATEPDPKDR